MKITIFGERCSGTNWLEYLLVNNFECEMVWDAGYKHWFAYKDHDKIISQNSDVIYFGIVRNPIDYFMSFYEKKHNQPEERTRSIISFLFKEFYSIETDPKSLNYNKEIKKNGVLVDRNQNGCRYKNIFELRSQKCKFLFKKMPQITKNYFFIKYEDLKKEPEIKLQEVSDLFNFKKKFDNFYIEKKYVYKPAEGVDLSFHKNWICKENYSVKPRIRKNIIENIDKKIEQEMGYMNIGFV
jgi:hypothetical protein